MALPRKIGPSPVWVILADGQHDLTGEGEKAATKHAKDLKRMGFEVTIKWFNNWYDAEAYEDKIKG
jgi:hypothetical protein